MRTKIATIEVTYELRDGLHVFYSTDLPGLLVANRDPKTAYNDVSSAIELLLKLDDGITVTVAPAASFEEFRRQLKAPRIAESGMLETQSRTFVLQTA
ncbi:MAG: hypothetical protein WD673_12760 [Alphaproteobacteria bacterium]